MNQSVSADTRQDPRHIIRRLALGDTLTRAARVHTSRTAVVDGEERVSYAELEASANQLAYHLLATLKPGSCSTRA